MLYGTPPRATRRAAADRGTVLLVKAVGATGQHRHPSLAGKTRSLRVPSRPGEPPRSRRRRPPREPQTPHLLIRGLAMLIVLGVTGMIGFLIVADARRGHSAEAGTNPLPGNERLSSRTVDPAPLRLAEVFPDNRPVQPPGTAPYLLGMTHIDTECRIATTGALGDLLEQYGCNQVVRAELSAPYGNYQVTTGLFNLADAGGATEVDDQVRRLVETGDGGFAATVASRPGTDPASPAGTQVGWHASGHYLLYSVVTRPNGEVVNSDDPNVARITADLVDGYLAESVLGHRTSIA
ncbi:hypothetical protein ACWKSP_11865 [Micromonosporaceae bacterium Da 78-11]